MKQNNLPVKKGEMCTCKVVYKGKSAFHDDQVYQCEQGHISYNRKEGDACGYVSITVIEPKKED